MSNPDNLIRPPVLNLPENRAERQEVVMSVELRNAISGIVSQALRTEGIQIFNSVLNQNSNEFSGVDQTINREHSASIGDLDKIPDIVRSLREFSGNNAEFVSWKKSVERILKIYEPIRGTAKYYGIISVIRNKIVGQADNVLESYNIPLNWDCISRCLVTHYADKRDVSSLEFQLTSLVQGRQTIQEFYQEVYACLSLILNKLSSLEMGNEALNILTKTYREKALDTFVRGLNGDMPRLLAVKEPRDLPQALALCQKLENQTFRSNYAHNTRSGARRYPIPPQLPPKNNTFSNRPATSYPKQNFVSTRTPYRFEQYYPTFQPRNTFPQFNSYQNDQQPPPRPLAPKPSQRPEPMEVDESIRTRNLNYMNRPRAMHQFQGKRPTQPSFQARPPPKVQRNFHTFSEEGNYELAIAEEDKNHNETLQDYASNCLEYQEVDTEKSEDNFVDIHFLD